MRPFRKKSAIILSTLFTLIHYGFSFSVFLFLASYASDIDGRNPVLSLFSQKIVIGAFYLLLFPFGYLPFGVLVNSAVLGGILYYLLTRNALKKNTAS